MADNKFDLQAFLNDPKVQSNKTEAVQYLQTKGIVDSSGNPVKGMYKETPATSSGIWGFVKNLVSAPATIIARPFQAAADLGSYLGTTIEANKASQEGKTTSSTAILAADAQREKQAQTQTTGPGGIIAPTPATTTDLKKDVGRGIQTVAFGMPGFVSGGAALGLGSSLEQGNDLMSIQTAFQTALGAGGGKILGVIGKPIFNVAGKVVGEVTPQYLKDIIAKGGQAITDFAAQHEILPQGVKDITNTVGNKITNVGNVTKQAIVDEYKGSAVDTAISSVKQKIGGVFANKTQAEILATPESEIYKLSPAERKVFYDAHTSAIAERSAQVEQQVKQELAQKTTQLQTEAETLNRELAVASRDKVIELRPKIRAALGSQSQEYRRLVDEEIAPHKDLPVTAQEVSNFIDTKFSEDPAKALAIKTKVGITDTTNMDAETTIGQLYDKSKSLGQDISTTVKKGTRVYTPDEKLTDDTIHTITDIMKQKGVDLSGSRKFWAQYAPIRNQLVSEAKPFLQAPTQTKTFANTLVRVSKGADVNNENFIKEVESLLGEKVSKEATDILAKLSANEKQAIADKMAAESKITEEKLLKEKALQNWSDRKFIIEQAAAKRKAFKDAVKIVAYISGYEGVRHFVPLLP